MDVRLPRLGEGADSGTVVSLFVKEGDAIEKDQNILELENEKAVAPIPSPVAGTVSKVHVKVGDKVSVGQTLISVDGKTGAAVTPPADEPLPAQRKQPEPKLAAAQPPRAERTVSSAFPPPASPGVRKLARELGIDLTRVTGSEAGGRIVATDVRAYIEALQKDAGATPQAAQKPAAERVDFSKWGAVTRKPMSPLRRIIAEHMAASWTTIPHVTQFDEADITALLALKKKHEAAYKRKGGHLTLTPFIMKAAVTALKKHPIFNASLDDVGGEIVFKDYYHFGVAVDTEAGLIVPVVKNVDRKSLLELSTELDELAAKTRARKVSLDELKGGSFTISNQGGIGGGHFTPIINKPEVAILGVGRGVSRLVSAKQKIESHTLLPLCLSYDHRVIDGAEAARFMVDFVQALQSFKDTDIKP